jgi:hypothetical protein
VYGTPPTLQDCNFFLSFYFVVPDALKRYNFRLLCVSAAEGGESRFLKDPRIEDPREEGRVGSF